MTKLSSCLFHVLLGTIVTILFHATNSLAWSSTITFKSRPENSVVLSAVRKDKEEEQRPAGSSSRRRDFVLGGLSSAVLTVPSVANAVRAIGGAEEDCRAAGNCLEIGELDGAIGWTWGAKDRCEATDPRCGPGGQIMDTLPSSPVPDTLGLDITTIVALEFSIGTRSDSEKVVIRLGLYGKQNPESEKQFVQFVTTGLKTTSDLVFENGMGVESAPVSLNRGGTLNQIQPGTRLDIGIDTSVDCPILIIAPFSPSS